MKISIPIYVLCWIVGVIGYAIIFFSGTMALGGMAPMLPILIGCAVGLLIPQEWCIIIDGSADDEQ